MIRTAALALLLLCGVGCADSVEERRASVYELKANPTAENLTRLREMLADPDKDVRATALFALVGLGPEDAAQLALAGLEDQDGFVRSIAAKLLGDLGDPRHAGALASRLAGDPDPWVRQRSAEALEQVGGDEAARALTLGLEDPIKSVRHAAVIGLNRLDPGAATPALARLLIEDSEWDVRVQAAVGLGRTGNPEVLPVLEAALEDPNEFVRAAASNAIALQKKLASAPAETP